MAKIEAHQSILLTVIVTHYNYSGFVREALLSVASQTHQNFECVVVDDFSENSHRAELSRVVSELADPRFRTLELPENGGQTNAVFEGLRHSSGEFVSLLDPDDLYAPDFLARMLSCHLNKATYAAVAACEMGLFRVGGCKLTNSYVGFKHRAIEDGSLMRKEACLADFGFSAYYPPYLPGWLWGTTSSLMFRRDALEALRRESYMPNNKIHADTYCVTGAHMLGGTLFIDELLSWRGLHKENSFEAEWVVSGKQIRWRPGLVDPTQGIRRFAMETLLENGRAKTLHPTMLATVLSKNFTRDVINEMLKAYPSYNYLRSELETAFWPKLQKYLKIKPLITSSNDKPA